MEPFDLRKWNGFKAAGGDPAKTAVVDQMTIDSRRIHSPHALFVALKGKTHDGHCFITKAVNAGAKFALIDKNWELQTTHPNITLLRVENPLKSFQEIVKTYRNEFSCKVIGITGSYGKTMVKDLLQAILSTSKIVAASPESFNSQIGVPLSLLRINKDTEIALIEAGASQIGEMEALANLISPDCTILTHVGRKHLSTLGSLENIASELLKLTKMTSPNGWVVLPQMPMTLPHLDSIKAKKLFWNIPSNDLPHAQCTSEARSHNASHTITFPDGSIEVISPLLGHDYFVDLINLAIKPAWLLGISSENIIKTLKQYIPEPMSTEIWQSPFGTTFVNEPYSSDPFSIDLALNHFRLCSNEGKKIFLFGGLRGESEIRGEDYSRIGTALAATAPDKLMLIGNHNFNPLIDELNKCTNKGEITRHSTYKEAVLKLKHTVKPQDLVVIKGEKKYLLDHLTEAFHGSICPNQCFINLAAIQSNIASIRNKLGRDTRLMAMVKAFAYGMNDIRMSQFLCENGIDILGVSYIDEGIALKRAGIVQDIFSIHASPFEAAKVAEWGLEAGVSDLLTIAALADAAKKHGTIIKVHLHIDTGMNRLGCRPENALLLAKHILSFPSLKLEGIMTHFASADDHKEDSFTFTQIDRFTDVIKDLEAAGIDIPWKHAANSSAMMRFPDARFNMARIGLALYGLNPSEKAKEALDLRPAISLMSRIAGINQCKKGDSVSYGRNYVIEQNDQRIAVIPIGYFDGIHRSYGGKGYVMIHGSTAPMVGNICMDFLMVDVTHIPKAAIGDPVLIFGGDAYGNFLAPEELASQGNSIAHELITCLGPRIQRVFIHEETQRSC